MKVQVKFAWTTHSERNELQTLSERTTSIIKSTLSTAYIGVSVYEHRFWAFRGVFSEWQTSERDSLSEEFESNVRWAQILRVSEMFRKMY
jgi:hypothetical protein